VCGAQSTTRVKPFICTMPMRLDEGWNQIQFNLSDFTRRAYGTNYIETLRVQIHANCRIRRIYFSDRLYSEEELPPEFKLFLPIQVCMQTIITVTCFPLCYSTHPHPDPTTRVIKTHIDCITQLEYLRTAVLFLILIYCYLFAQKTA